MAAAAMVAPSSIAGPSRPRHPNPHIRKLLTRPGPYCDSPTSYPPADPSPSHFLTTQCKILVIGAGGLGCEILCNLALSGFRDIHVIDMDTIDVSNLNRQFLFREKDVGQSKAETAAAFVMKRCPGVTVTPYHGKIQDKGDDYYLSFDVIVCGLDSVDARRWISATLVNLVDDENPKSLKPLIDGGTEGFKGQARVILPTITSCYECSLDMLTRQTTFPICTIANTPRLPEHCIEWASVLEWPKVHGEGKKVDGDDPEHISWLLSRAQERAKEHGITGVTWELTQGVVKNIIPAIASTNAVIAAACTQEALKIATGCNPFLNNYTMYTGNEGVYTYTFEHQKRAECPVCGGEARSFPVKAEETVGDVVERLKEVQDLQIKRPSLAFSGDASDAGKAGKPLYFQAPKQLEEATRPNLERKCAEVFEEGDEVDVTDAGLPFQLTLVITFEGGSVA
ncbi:hypothetical protein BDZ90DRAFT_233828 [Jaminaea rosea]|uniref:NEDD8-activating enzyme E1 catalytic subunit n=1 Tax=Jaminaea rosea TaxID=1569628 RepID=A0A316ULJ4_9BASI|nr:hypothetical protein BDZ90DRAFT_233828 [Jaminaea rosea]PWN25814.1 hypothetical protein BDZ90DRAFT_233828 [Jaminaea rosea]